MQSMSGHSVSLKPILILSSHLHVNLPIVSFRQVPQPKPAFFLSPMWDINPAHLVLFDLSTPEGVHIIILPIMPFSSASCYFLPPRPKQLPQHPVETLPADVLPLMWYQVTLSHKAVIISWWNCSGLQNLILPSLTENTVLSSSSSTKFSHKFKKLLNWHLKFEVIIYQISNTVYMSHVGKKTRLLTDR